LVKVWVKNEKKMFFYIKYGSKNGSGILFLYKCMGQKMAHEVLRVNFLSKYA